jgi:DNA-binding PadR family transcriptional regulator
MDGGNTDQQINDTIDWLVANDFLSISWDSDGNDYYSLTDAGHSLNSVLSVFEEESDDGYQVC